jgi:hypothetical protein
MASREVSFLIGQYGYTLKSLMSTRVLRFSRQLNLVLRSVISQLAINFIYFDPTLYWLNPLIGRARYNWANISDFVNTPFYQYIHCKSVICANGENIIR